MRRCETLVASRDNLLETRDKIRNAVHREEESIALFKEEQNACILDLRLVGGKHNCFCLCSCFKKPPFEIQKVCFIKP